MRSYKVIVLGLHGSGKTSYLATTFHKLSAVGAGGFFLEAGSPDEGLRLTKLWEQLLRATGLLRATPPGEVTAWHFRALVKAHDLRNHPALQFSLLDYAGERLARGLADPAFERTVEEADTVLGILDGQRVLEFMQEQAGVLRTRRRERYHALYENLAVVTRQMQRNQGGRPTHLVLTKWDLFDGTDDALALVRETLLREFDLFREFVAFRRKVGAPTRLIPVSSFGAGYVELKRGEMRRVPGSIPRPFYVEMPLACALHDIANAELRETLRELRTLLGQKNVRETIKVARGLGRIVEELDLGEALLSELALFLQRQIVGLPRPPALPGRLGEGDVRATIPPARAPAWLGESGWGRTLRILSRADPAKMRGALERAFDYVDRWSHGEVPPVGDAPSERERRHEQTLRGVKDEHSAYSYLRRSFADLIRDLDRAFPASDLARPLKGEGGER